MRIAMVVTAKTRGGVFSTVRDLALGLSSEGVQVSLYVDAALREAFENSCTAASLVRVHDLQDAVSAPCDIWHVHLHDSFDRVSLLLQLRRVLRHGRRGIVLDEHLPRTPRSDASLEYEPDTPPGTKKPFARQVKTLLKVVQYVLATRVIVHSLASATFLKDRYGLRTQKMVNIPIGVPATEALPVSANSGALRVLLLAVVCFRKGHDVLIEATRFATSPWQVVFAGGGSQLEVFRSLASERARQPVAFLGSLEDPRSALEQCDVLCVPSRSDASSVSALEAMMAGRPVVGTRVDGIPELIIEGETGLLVDVADPRALAEALDALSDRQKRLRMGEQARMVMLATRTLEHMTQTTLAAYKRIASHG